MSAQNRAPADQPARTHITTKIDESIFVAAAAGSGKTKSMVDRILNLIDQGKDIDNVAAVTFTERAAGELRDRIRRTLHDTKSDPAVSQEVRDRREQALNKIDGAMIGTLHGFAYRLLAENPIEAGLPVVFTVRDQTTAEIMREIEWERRLSDLIEDEDIADDFRALSEAGVRRAALKMAAETLDNQWDLVGDLFESPDAADYRQVVERCRRSAELLLEMRSQCTEPSDKAYVKITERLEPLVEAAPTVDSLAAVIALLSSDGGSVRIGNAGIKTNWADDVESVRTAASQYSDDCEQAKNELIELAGRRVICALAASVADAAEARIEAGQITFDDLLVLTRRLLRSNKEVRRKLHERYRHILIDEFQDTDSLQLSIALLIAADPEADGSHEELIPLAGGVFLVGDPQQSIYAFRGADLKLYLKVKDRVESEPDFATGQTLSVNFRTVDGVIDWINGTFKSVITFREHSQPEFSPLDAYRVDQGLAGPVVAVIGDELDVEKVDDARKIEAEDIAATIVESVGNWEVFDEELNEKRKARLGDIALLSWRRGRYDILTDALDTAKIPYRADGTSMSYTAPEIRALFHALRVIDDPSDDFSLVLALGSVLFGCGDDDLLRAKQALGRRGLRIGRGLEEIPEDNPVREALEYLWSLREDARIASPSELLERLVEDRRLLELAHEFARPRDLWRRVRVVIDQAREWTAANGGSLAAYIEWAKRNQEDRLRTREAIVPETDDDAVQIITLHGAKGLEFPIVIVFDLVDEKGAGRDPSIEIEDGRWDFWLASGAMSHAIREGKETYLDRAFDERMRLLYVACTRARDHLVVCTHRPAPKNPDRVVARPSSAVVIAAASAEEFVDEFTPARGAVFEGGAASGERTPLMALDEWNALHERIVASAGTPEAISVTGLIREQPKVIRTPMEVSVAATADVTVDAGAAEAGILRRRFGGTRFGSAVHTVLEEVTFGDSDSVELLAVRAAAAEGIDSESGAVAAVAKSALATSALERAAEATRAWREMFIADEIDGRVVEGVVDLLIEDADGNLVIIDYKTDDISQEEFVKQSESHYAAQLTQYAGLVERVAGRAVSEAWLLHLREDGAGEVRVGVDSSPGGSYR